MKQSLQAICGLVMLAVFAGCANEAGEERSMLGESRQDLALAPSTEGTATADGAHDAAPQAAGDSTDPTTPDRPQPEPWSTKASLSKPLPSPDDPRRRATNAAEASDDDAPQPEPWVDPGAITRTSNHQ